MLLIPKEFGREAQPPTVLYNLLNQETFIVASICLMFGYWSPPSSILFSIIFFRNFGVEPFHINKSNNESILTNKDSFGLGRDSRIWINFDISKLFIIVILPISVRFCSCQILISFWISNNFGSIFKSVIFLRSVTS